jgi:hypothetical protein
MRFAGQVSSSIATTSTTTSTMKGKNELRTILGRMA